MKRYLKPNLPKSDKQMIAAFCFDLLKELEVPAENRNKIFTPLFGLCSNMSYWAYNKEYYGKANLFYDNFKDDYPFNTDVGEYMDECTAGNCFENKARMDFVRHWAAKHIDKGE